VWASRTLGQEGLVMRLRRTSAIAAIAAAVAATTAAVYPSAPADRLAPMPALTAPGLAARYTADAHQIARAASAASRAGNTGLAHSLNAMRGGQFLDFNPAGQGVAVQVFGNLAAAPRAAVIVPGSDTSLTTFGSRGTASPEGAARALAAQARKLDHRARLAVIAWLGYLTPRTLSPAVMTSGDAGQGADALRPFVNDLVSHGHQVALICHSYGSVVCGLAAAHVPASDIAMVGSPGMDASSVRALHTTARVWAGRGTGDWIEHLPPGQFLGLGFGQDPMAPAFGARIFDGGSGGPSDHLQPRRNALPHPAPLPPPC